ncbi:MAG: hypothetical protein HQK51_20135 [Oligoflexia bacterium]|nr:hypothetical protein [Oligoflexia bacterium]
MLNEKNILLKQLQKNSLASFYIIALDFSLRKEILWDWSISFLEEVLKFYSNENNLPKKTVMKNVLAHADFLFITRRRQYANGNNETEEIKETEKTEKAEEKADLLRPYKLCEFDDFFTFLNLKNFQLPHRFIVIEDAHLMAEELANKLLKSLEDTPEHITIFLLRPSEKELIGTIVSRALKIRCSLPSSDSNKKIKDKIKDKKKDKKKASEAANDQLNKFLKEFKESGNISNIDKLSDSELLLNSFFIHILDLECEATTQRTVASYAHKEEFLKELKWYYTSLEFNNNRIERIYSLLELYGKYSINR